VWRDRAALPDDLVFDVEYLGGHMPTFALNFSRPGAQVVAQYFNFLRLGYQGYRDVHMACRHTAQWIASQIGKMDEFELVSRADNLPVFAFAARAGSGVDVHDVSEGLRARGWLVPAYPLPPAMDEKSVLRIVVRNGLSRDLAVMLVDDIEQVGRRLAHPAATPPAGPRRTGFHH
jgi:glutamate decarboxylase